MGSGTSPSRATGLLLVLSGSSGAGKDAVLARMKEQGYPFRHVVTVTTRPRRPTEVQGIDYDFVSESEFQDMLHRGELLEWAQVYGHHYGVPKESVRRALQDGQDAVVRVDVQGAATIKELLPEAVLVFLASARPSSVGEYEERLRQRNTESDAQLGLRLQRVEEELKSLPIFDYVVVNRQGGLDEAVSQVACIMAAEKCRVNPRAVVFP